MNNAISIHACRRPGLAGWQQKSLASKTASNPQRTSLIPDSENPFCSSISNPKHPEISTWSYSESLRMTHVQVEGKRREKPQGGEIAAKRRRRPSHCIAFASQHCCRCCYPGTSTAIMKTGTVLLGAAVVLAAVSSVNAFTLAPKNSLVVRAAVTPLSMVATEPEIINGEAKPRKTREVCCIF